MEREDRAATPEWLRAVTGAVGRPLPDEPVSESPRDLLHKVVRELSIPRRMSCWASAGPGELGAAEVFRVRPSRSLHVVGTSRLASELRRLITDGEEPGWELHPVPGGHTPLHALATPLFRLSGSGRFYNLLDRSAFTYVEEVAATPDECLLDLRNGGPRFVAAVRQVISELGLDIPAERGSMAPDGKRPGGQPLPVLAPRTLRALQVTAAWAVAEQGARTAGDLIPLADGTRQLPPDIAAAWDHIRQLDLRQIAGPLLPATSLAGLATELLAEVDQRRQLILSTRTFAPPKRRTYDSLAAELGVTRERVRQLEEAALIKLAQAAADDRYAPLRWRAVSASSPGPDRHRAAEDAPTWLDGLLLWLRKHLS
jgi:hypothetical protein